MKNHGNDLKKMNVAQSESIISLLIMPSQSNVIEDNYHERPFYGAIISDHLKITPALMSR